MPASHREVEKRLDLLCIEIGRLQEAIWEQLESLEMEGLLLPQMEEHAGAVMRDVSFWIDQCTLAEKSPPVLLRRMEVHLGRLVRLSELLEGQRGHEKAASGQDSADA
jgi:hypothetical protein